MYEILTLAFMLFTGTGVPMACEGEFSPPKALAQALVKEVGGIVEIREADPTGYIWSLFVNRLYLEGVFYQKGDNVVVCSITFAIKVSEAGDLLFIWDESQRES